VLVRRMLAIKAADRWSTGVLLVQAPIIAALVAGIFAAKTTQPLDASSWPDVARALATSTFLVALAAIWFGCSNAAREIVAERAVYRRERMVGLGLGAYLVAKVLVLAGLCGLQCGALMAIVRNGCGLEGPAGDGLLVLFLAANVAAMIGLAVSAVVRTAEAAAVILPLVILPMVMLGGILLPLPELPRAAVLAADAMPSRWAFESLFLAEADARPTGERPDPDDPARRRTEDLAEAWFPRDGWRSGRGTPVLVLAAGWLIGMAVVRLVMARRDARWRN